MRRFRKEDANVSYGSVGGKIKRYREMRGYTQRELGVRCGFTESTADVRIAQYEKNKKLPRAGALRDIAAALGVDASALFDADLMSDDLMCHALFDIEDFHGLHPVKKPDGYYLCFGGPSLKSPHEDAYSRCFSFLEKWYEMRQKYAASDDDSEEEKEEKEKAYLLWKAEYPQNLNSEQEEERRVDREIERLQAEKDYLNAKKYSKKELERIDETMNPILSDVRESYKPVERVSDLILLIKRMLESGVEAFRFSRQKKRIEEEGYLHLISVKTESVLGDEAKMKAFAEFICATETLEEYGIEVSRRVESRDEELYLAYYYPSEMYDYLRPVSACWDDMVFLVEREGIKPHWEIEKLEKEFMKKITGENDAELTDADENG